MRQYFNPRSRMGSDRLLTIVKIFIGISIHAPRMGSDRLHSDRLLLRIISIHAPRMGSDLLGGIFANKQQHFNPRSPHGERHVLTILTTIETIISIHAPRMGSDP